MIEAAFKMPLIGSEEGQVIYQDQTIYLMQQAINVSNPFSLEQWRYEPKNGWALVDVTDEMFRFVKQVDYVTWTGELTPWKVNVFEIGKGIYSLNGALGSSTKFKLNPAGEEIYVVQAAFAIIKDFNEQTTSKVTESVDTSPKSKILFFRASENGLQKIDIQTGFEWIPNGNVVDIKTIDFNGDGYDDIFIDTQSENGLPVILLNDRNGGFNYMEKIETDSAYKYYYVDRGSSIVDDFNNDGLPDLITYWPNGQDLASGLSMSGYRYYLGSSNASFG
jgi:hypothetical protein